MAVLSLYDSTAVNLPFSLIDAAIVLLIAAAVWAGYRSGFIATTYGLATWIVSFAAAVIFQAQAARLVENFGVLPATAQPVGFIVVLVLVEGLFSIAGFFALTPIVRAVHRVRSLEKADRITGVVPAAARALFVIAIVLAAVVVSPVGSDVKAAVESSRIARALIDQISALQPTLAMLSGHVGETVPLFVTKLGEDQREELDLPSNLQLSADPVAERQMVDLVNDERAAVGLARLQWDDRLLPVARQHSEEMFRLKYFAHQSPVSGSPFDRLKAAGITYARAGENLAYAQSVSVAHRGLMQSQGHRENILRPEFTHIAIGVISAGPYGRMFTQMFVTP
ncbi:MAG: CvpA family protein [Chloroflexota bacterium]|nr:CvpA family protein [Chloroflexota bacterium]